MLWVPGRNDTFFHPHVGETLARHGIHLYVLSYRRVGECRRLGLFTDPMHNSHCVTGNFSEYHEDVRMAIERMRSDGIDDILGYGHSTGGTILLSYLMEHGDADFSGFCFNSPFLDWGWVGGSLIKFAITTLPALLTRLRLWSADSELLAGGGSNAWALQLQSQYYFDPRSRPLYNVPVTVGFCCGINDVHAKLRKLGRAGVAITRKPFVVFTSKGDDILDGDATAEQAHAIGPSRTLVQLSYARHDVFTSADASVVQGALAYLDTWLKSIVSADEKDGAACVR